MIRKHLKKIAALSAAGLWAFSILLPQAWSQFESRVRNSDDIDFIGSISVRSDVFTIKDQDDSTKKMQFDLSGITTGTTRTFVVPNASGTFATLAGTETLTNKTLTNPTINAQAGILNLPDETTASQTAEGRVGWSGANDLLTIGTGASRKTYLDTNSTQTATNKTLTSATLTTPVINGAITGDGTVAGIHLYNNGAHVGASAGWVLATLSDVGRMATLPAASSGATLVVKLNNLKVGDVITGFYLIGQIESDGGAVTLDCALRKATAAAADLTDASISSMTQLSVTADTAVTATNARKVLASPQTVVSDATYYLLISGTTAALTDVDLAAVALEITHNLFFVE